MALAVGLTPELLPMVVSVTLSRGALHMAKKRVIVKRLAAIQNLGSMDVLCTDKTGTLTEAKIRLEQHVDPQGRPSERVLELAYLNSFFETGLKSPLDEAILAHEHIDVSAWKKIDEVPFDFERRRVSVLLDKGETRWLVVKGASEEIIGLCTHYEDRAPKPRVPLDEAAQERYTASTSPSKKKASACWASPGARFRRTILMPWWATKRNWCSPGLPPSSIRPRKAPAPHLPRSRKRRRQSRSLPATANW